jgi:hypothetical protein
VLAENAAFRTFSLGIDVHALVGLPDAGQPAQRAKVGEAIRGYVAWLGEDIGGMRQHG